MRNPHFATKPMKGDTLAASYLLLVFGLVLRAIYLSEPAPPTLNTPAACSRGGFLGLGCAKGCVKIQGKCVVSSILKDPETDPVGLSGKALMRKRSTKNCLAAADAFESAADAAAAPGTPRGSAPWRVAAQNHLFAADALNCAMRTHGKGNILLVEGTLDTADNKKFWGQHGPRALSLARAALAEDPDLISYDLARVIELDAFMYKTASTGIVRNALTGAGVEFKKLADEFTATFPSFDGGVGYTYLAGFYHVAPWPLGDKKRALVEAERAVATSGRSKRNNYYVCLFKYVAGDKAGAQAACSAATTARCEGNTEPDYCHFLTEQVERVNALAKKMA